MTVTSLIQGHVEAVLNGETVESRLALLDDSNWMDDQTKRTHKYFLTSFCWMGALEPLCSTVIDLAPDLQLKLNRSRKTIVDRELPGVRTDSDGWLVIEGRWIRDGVWLSNWQWDQKKMMMIPLMPLMMRNVPAHGSGPWSNFLPQVLAELEKIGRSWPRA